MIHPPLKTHFPAPNAGQEKFKRRPVAPTEKYVLIEQMGPPTFWHPGNLGGRFWPPSSPTKYEFDEINELSPGVTSVLGGFLRFISFLSYFVRMDRWQATAQRGVPFVPPRSGQDPALPGGMWAG